MITIVMTYFERQFQLTKTLLSMSASKAKFNVIVVDDLSRNPIVLPDVKFPVQVIQTKNKCWTNSEPAYNLGILTAMQAEEKPDIIVLQNAECYHVGDVLKYAEDHLTDKNYLSFSCYSINEKTTFNGEPVFNGVRAQFDGDEGWYNHPVIHPRAYDFCSAITASNLMKLNGYDERFAFGCGYGDDYLLARIKMMHLKVEIVEQPFVVHQWHYNHPIQADKRILVQRNKELFVKLVKENNHRAKHYLVPDLCECNL